jgi:hypothetical protein
VVVTVVAVRMMQVAVHQIIDVVAMRHGRMAAVGPMDVIGGVTAAAMFRRARGGVRGIYLELVLFHLSPLGMMQVTVVEIVHVVAMLNGSVAAARTVLVRVVGVMAHNNTSC